MRAAKKGNIEEKDAFRDKLVAMRRITKVVKGGRIFSFDALVVVGDGNGRVGFGRGKSREVPLAIQKANESARKNMVFIQLDNGTLFHPIKAQYGASQIFMKPASDGTGVIAGNAMRAVFEMLGVRNILAKTIGASNPINVVQATMKGLKEMSSPEKAALKRGKRVQDFMEEK
jgi:small subunit ribosomal protein S5